MTDTNLACDIEAKLDNRDLDRKKFNKTLYGDKLKEHMMKQILKLSLLEKLKDLG